MKKLTILLLSAAMALTLCACSKDKADTKSNSIANNKEAVSALNEVLDGVWDVHAGSSGCSIRAEGTAEALIDFVNNYGSVADEDGIAVITKNWSEELSSKDETYDAAELKENFDDVEAASYDADSTLNDNSDFQKVVNGIKQIIK